jgi:hypothetical protein
MATDGRFQGKMCLSAVIRIKEPACLDTNKVSAPGGGGSKSKPGKKPAEAESSEQVASVPKA